MITKELIEDINVAALEAYGAPLAEHDDPYFNDFLLAFVRIRAERLESARKQGCPDKLDEIESDLQYLFGRAAKEGHESAMRLAGEVANKIQEYRLVERQRERQAVPDGYLYEEISGHKGYFVGPIHENTKWQVEHHDLKLTPFWFAAAPSPELISPPRAIPLADLNRRVEVETVLLSVFAGKRGPLTKEECKNLAFKLGVPDEHSKKEWYVPAGENKEAE